MGNYGETKNKKIGVIGTNATINSGEHKRQILELMPDAQVFVKGCPLFVPLIEEGLWEDPVTDEIARRYLTEFTQQDKDIDTLILGCTHYPLIRSTLGRIAGEKVTLVNPAYETAVELRSLLEREGIANDGNHAAFDNPYEFF